MAHLALDDHFSADAITSSEERWVLALSQAVAFLSARLAHMLNPMERHQLIDHPMYVLKARLLPTVQQCQSAHIPCTNILGVIELTNVGHLSAPDQTLDEKQLHSTSNSL